MRLRCGNWNHGWKRVQAKLVNFLEFVSIIDFRITLKRWLLSIGLPVTCLFLSKIHFVKSFSNFVLSMMHGVPHLVSGSWGRSIIWIIVIAIMCIFTGWCVIERLMDYFDYRVVLKKCHENLRRWLKMTQKWPKSTFSDSKWPKMRWLTQKRPKRGGFQDELF